MRHKLHQCTTMEHHHRTTPWTPPCSTTMERHIGAPPWSPTVEPMHYGAPSWSTNMEPHRGDPLWSTIMEHQHGALPRGTTSNHRLFLAEGSVKIFRHRRLPESSSVPLSANVKFIGQLNLQLCLAQQKRQASFYASQHGTQQWTMHHRLLLALNFETSLLNSKSARDKSSP
jgi:hypothetical protein